MKVNGEYKNYQYSLCSDYIYSLKHKRTHLLYTKVMQTAKITY
jgi:hypothetical protein